MEKLDKVIAGLSECSRIPGRLCEKCPYWDCIDYTCLQALRMDALEVILDLREKLKTAKDGRLELGRRCRELEAERDDLNRRIDKYVDALHECGLAMQSMEPVVHAHWVMRGGRRYCSACGTMACVTRDRDDFWYTVGTKRCPECGAHMDEEVADG